MKSLWLASVLLSTDPRPHRGEVRENVVRVKREAVCIKANTTRQLHCMQYVARDIKCIVMIGQQQCCSE